MNNNKYIVRCHTLIDLTALEEFINYYANIGYELISITSLELRGMLIFKRV